MLSKCYALVIQKASKIKQVSRITGPIQTIYLNIITEHLEEKSKNILGQFLFTL